MKKNTPVLLSIDTTTFRVRRYVGKELMFNVRFDRIMQPEEVEQMRVNPRTFMMENTTPPAGEAA